MFSLLIPALFVLASSSPVSIGNPELFEATYVLSDGLDLRAWIDLRRDGSFEYSWDGSLLSKTARFDGDAPHE